jgi:hypothetical protein
MRHINIYVIITFEMAILKISCNLGFNWGGRGRNPPANVRLKMQLIVNALTFI